MKNCIVTPTFSEHFPFIPDYLKSFSKLDTDKDNFEICFTISKDEFADFQKIVLKFPDLNVRVLFFEDILTHFNILYTPDELLKKYGKFSFQTLKKFYTMLYLGPNYRFLVLDSESILFSRCNINRLFDDFFEHPFISYSNMDKRYKSSVFTRDIKLNSAFILKSQKIQNLWFLENFVWFYDYKILNDMFSQYGSPFDVIDKVFNDAFGIRNTSVFEIDLYQSFVYLHHKKYKYNLVDTDIMLDKLSNSGLYRKQLDERFDGACGLLEHATLFLTRDNYKSLANEFNDNHFNIIRCNETTMKNYILQKNFLNIVSPAILAASQNHMFGVKNTLKKRLLFSIKYAGWEKIKSHTVFFIKPVLLFLQWLYQPIYLIINLLIFVLKFITCIIVMLRK